MISNLKNLVYNLDKFNNSYSNTVKLKQNDIRTLEIHVYDNGEELDLTGYTAVVKWVNANNTVAPLTTSNIKIKNNTIFVKMIADCTRSSGVAKWELVLSKNDSIDYSFTQEIKILSSVEQGQEESKNVSTLLEDVTKAQEEATKFVNTYGNLYGISDKVDELNNTKAEKTDLNITNERINNLMDLPNGSTNNDARLEDIRIAWNGKTVYPTPGQSTRRQIAELHNTLKEYEENNKMMTKFINELTNTTEVNIDNGRLEDITDEYGNIITGTTTVVKNNNKVVFFDDFDRGLDEKKWTIINNNKTDFPHYQSIWTNDPNIVYTEGSYLVLKCQKAEIPDSTKTYFAGHISTHDKFAIRKGKISARIKMCHDIGNGFSWTFFTFGQNDEWGKAPEFDIAEEFCGQLEKETTLQNGMVYPAGTIQTTFGANTHYRKSDNTDGTNFTTEIITFKRPGEEEIDYTYHRDNYQLKLNRWHVYSVEWNEEEIIYKIDDLITRKLKTSDLNNDGNTNWLSPQDIRFNIKATPFAKDDYSYMLVDWLKVESNDGYEPLFNIKQEDITIKKGTSVYINEPVITPTNATNVVFELESTNSEIATIENYTDQYYRVSKFVRGVKVGNCKINIKTPTGKMLSNFNVNVVD